jgi:hypothetical protein
MQSKNLDLDMQYKNLSLRHHNNHFTLFYVKKILLVRSTKPYGTFGACRSQHIHIIIDEIKVECRQKQRILNHQHGLQKTVKYYVLFIKLISCAAPIDGVHGSEFSNAVFRTRGNN